MRNRLVAAFVGLTVAVIALYGVPRGFLLADLVQSQEQRKTERTVDLVEVVVLDLQERGAPVTPELLGQLVHEGERLEVMPAQGVPVVAGSAGGPSPDTITATRVLPDGTSVALSRSGELVDDRIVQALLPLVVIGLALVLLAVLAAFWLGRLLSRPFQELAVAAHRLGTGDFALQVPHYKVPEVKLIGTALRDSARQLDAMVRKERDFTVQASHLLRTPVTALRLDLEDISLWPQTPADVSAQLDASIAELDRLSSSITALLEASSSSSTGKAGLFDLGEEVRSIVTERAGASHAGDGRVLHTRSGPLPVQLPRDAVRRSVALLLDHVLAGGPGTVAVETTDRQTHLLVRMVRDGTPHTQAPDESALRSGREMAASLGGTVVMLVPPDHGLELMLPRAVTSL